jgi:hypothetical protein
MLINLLNLCLSHIFFNVFVKSVPTQPSKIVIPLDIFQQHLPEIFFQPKVREMEINKMLA